MNYQLFYYYLIYFCSLKIIKKNLLKNFIKTSVIFLFVTFGIIVFQFFITKNMGYTGSLKYAFFIENNQIIFEEDFLLI